MRSFLSVVVLCVLLLTMDSCSGRKSGADERPESKEAKALLQGVWVDTETDNIVFKMQGDSVFYPDSTSMPAYFKVIDDTLYIGSSSRYHIERQSEHFIWFQSNDGDLMKLNKLDEQSQEDFEPQPAQVLMVTEVTKKDTVVFWEGQRYHLYVAINPTKYKVTRHTLNEDGLDVENVYYDNIIHLSVFKGSQQLYSRDFRKQQYEKLVPAQFYNESVISDMVYSKTDAQGFHLDLSICRPGDASCYMLEHVVSFDGQLTTKK
jgi:hypothetical protein